MSGGLENLSVLSLKKGARAIVVGMAMPQVAEQLPIMQRLSELGFMPGEEISVVAKSFRDRVAVRIGNTIFALRGHEAALIQIRCTA